MLENFEGRLESFSPSELSESPSNLEAERPFSGMEQPFSDNSILNGIADLEEDFLDSERPTDYLPCEKNFSNKEIHNEPENLANSNDAENKQEGLTDEQKQELKEQTGWPDEVIDAIGSMEEAEVYKEAGLKAVEVDGKWCLVKNEIDMDQKDEDGITNKERMERGRPPLTKDREEIELHHIGQKQDSPLAELTMEEHRGAGNDTILHDKTKESEIDRNAFGKERKEHWKSRANNAEGA